MVEGDYEQHSIEHEVLGLPSGFKATYDGTYYYIWIGGVKFIRYNPTTKEVAIEGEIITNETF